MAQTQFDNGLLNPSTIGGLDYSSTTKYVNDQHRVYEQNRYAVESLQRAVSRLEGDNTKLQNKLADEKKRKLITVDGNQIKDIKPDGYVRSLILTGFNLLKKPCYVFSHIQEVIITTTNTRSTDLTGGIVVVVIMDDGRCVSASSEHYRFGVGDDILPAISEVMEKIVDQFMFVNEEYKPSAAQSMFDAYATEVNSGS